MGIIFALCSLAFAGVNDFFFKQYIQKEAQPLGRFVTGIGIVWSAIFGIAFLLSDENWRGSKWYIPVAAGLSCAVANLLFIGSLKFISAGTGSTIYRLNLVIAAVMGILILGESVTILKIVGVTLGGASVLMLKNNGPQAKYSDHHVRAVILLIIACILRATMGILFKLANTHNIPKFEVMSICGICWVVGGIVFGIIRREQFSWHGRTWRYSMISGLFVCGIVYFLFMATRFGDASIVIPIAQLSFIVTSVLGLLFHKERFGWRKCAAIALAGMCIVALSIGS